MKNVEEWFMINRGKPPALPGDSQSLTVPGVEERGSLR